MSTESMYDNHPFIRVVWFFCLFICSNARVFQYYVR